MANPPRLATESMAGRRPYQEDSVLAEKLGDGRVLLAVADGMGGHAAGEVASALALETLVEAVIDGHSLDGAFTLANERVHLKAMEPGKQGMGTTLVAVLVDGEEFTVANVGDSRGYLLSDGGIRRITEDHSFVAEAIKRGQSEAEAMATPWKDALTRSIGTDEQVEVDVFGPFPTEDDFALIVCSDGLYKTLTDDDLRDYYLHSGGPRGAAQALVFEAFGNGSDDNISVAIIEFGEVPREITTGTMPLEFEAPEDHQEGPAEGAGEDNAGVGTVSEATPADRETNEGDMPRLPDFSFGIVRVVVVVVALVLLLLGLFVRS